MSGPEPIASPEPGDAHTTSLAVWDLASPVIAGRRATLKVGVACPCACDLTGTRIDVYTEAGTRVGGGSLGQARWPGTAALHWAELDVAAPETEGDHAWRVEASPPEPSHGQAVSSLRVVASRPPEHRVTLEVIEQGSGVPVSGIELRLGGFRAATNDAGIAQVEVPGGSYEVCAWKIGYDLLSRTTRIAGDTTIQLEVAVTPEPEQPYWM